MSLTIRAKIVLKSGKTILSVYPLDYELVSIDSVYIWRYMHYFNRDMTGCLYLELSDDRKIKESWDLRFEPEDLLLIED